MGKPPSGYNKSTGKLSTGKLSTGKTGSGKASAGKIKRDIRSVKRLLKVPDLPPTVVQENERKVAMLENKLVETKLSNVSQKYKMVRFFEKRKLFRKLKSARAKHGDESSEVQGIRDKINYIVYYPLGEKYISVIPKEIYTDEKIISKQNDLISSISEKVKLGELEDASQGEWSKDKNVSMSRIKSLQAPELSLKERKIHSEPSPQPADTDDFFIIDRGS